MSWFTAAARGNIAELERHLKRGQKVDAKDRTGWTALQHAIRKGQVKAVEFLLNSKAKPNFAGAALVAIDARRPDLLEMLLAHGLDPNGGARGAGLYVEKAIDVLALERDGGSRKGVTASPAGRCLALLLDAGARLTKQKWTDGASPIRFPVATEDAALLRYLIERGADLDEPMDKRDDLTPLMWCAWYQSSSPDIIRALVAGGANLEQTNRKGLTALDVATVGLWPRNNPLAHERKHANLLRELGARETALSTKAAERRERAQAREKARKPKGDAIESIAVARRRGTIEITAYDTWISMAIRATDLDEMADAFEKARGVLEVRRDVTAAALSGKLPVPKTRYAVILKLKGHTWASIDVSWGDLWYAKPQQQLSRDAKQPIITCGHQDTASASFFTLHEKGKKRIDFGSCGMYEDDPRDTHLKSDAHDEDWWQQHADEKETIQALLREQDAYVPVFSTWEDKGKLSLEAFPADALEPANVERVMLVAFAGKSDD